MLNNTCTSSKFSNTTFRCAGKIYNCCLDDYFDHDITGIGIIISFVLTATLTFAAVVYGYYQKILPGVDLQEVDERLIEALHKWFRRQPISRSPEKQRQLEDAMEKFVLTLSDQQLVTGLAILIASLAKCDISVYSQIVAATLSWFSCITHLATLLVLRRYFESHPTVRTIRVIGMTLVALLLLVSQVFKIVTNNILHMCFYCNIAKDPSFSELYYVLQLYIITTFLTRAYFERIAALYIDSKRPAKHTFLRIMGGLPNTFSLASAANSSFLSELSTILFMASLGFTDLIDALVHGMKVSFGFGQLVAMMLLILPVLVAIEVIAPIVPATGEYTTLENDIKSVGHERRSVDNLGSDSISPTLPRSTTIDHQNTEEDINRPRKGLASDDGSRNGMIPLAPLASSVERKGLSDTITPAKATQIRRPPSTFRRFTVKHALVLHLLVAICKILTGVLFALEFGSGLVAVMFSTVVVSIVIFCWFVFHDLPIVHRALTVLHYVIRTKTQWHCPRFDKFMAFIDSRILKARDRRADDYTKGIVAAE